MPVTHVRPAARHHTFRPRIRPVSGFSLRDAPGRSGVVVTVDRRQGVGTSTIEPVPAPPAADDREAAEAGAEPSVAALVQEAVDTALESLDSLEHQARDIARRFRRGAQEEAQRGLAHLMQSMQTLLKLAAMAAGASGTDLDTLCERHHLNAEGQTNAAVNELIRHQIAGDSGALATALDRHFSAALLAWRRVFVALGGTPTGPYGDAA
jgi:hypothetical protein